MNKHSLTVGVTMVLMLTVAIGRAEAREIKFKSTSSGFVVSTDFNTDADPSPANLGLGAGKSNLGPFTQQVLIELKDPNFPDPPPSCTLPNGKPGIELTLQTGAGVFRFNRKGELLFTQFTSLTNCIDPTTREASFSGEEEIIGGTGKLANATGSLEFSGTGQILITDPARHFFGGTSVTHTGTIILPEGHAEH